jgi:hypothetical protein
LKKNISHATLLNHSRTFNRHEAYFSQYVLSRTTS